MVLRAGLALLTLGLCAGAWALAFTPHPLPGADGTPLQAIVRGPLAPPERFRVAVIPGSGCAGMGTVAERYFAGLLHARVLVLHKRTVAADATTAPADCGADFVRHDALAPWLADAQAALAAWQRELASPPLPLVLVGISEGAELLPALAARLHPAALVLVGSSGLDPAQAGRLQAERLGERAAWDELARAQAGAADDVSVVQGRSLRYWRDFWHWPVQVLLLTGAAGRLPALRGAGAGPRRAVLRGAPPRCRPRPAGAWARRRAVAVGAAGALGACARTGLVLGLH